MNHNWSATKQHLHPQSVAEIGRHSVLSGERIRQCETSSHSIKPGTHWRQSLIQHGWLCRNVDRVTLAPYTVTIKSKWRWTFGRQKLRTFDKVDRVEHVQMATMSSTVTWSTKSNELATVSFRQTGDKVESIGNNADSRLYRQFRRLSSLSPVCTGIMAIPASLVWWRHSE